MKTYNTQTNVSDQNLTTMMRRWSFKASESGYSVINLYQDCNDTLPIPMSWVISKYNLKRMDENLGKVNPQEYLEHH